MGRSQVRVKGEKMSQAISHEKKVTFVLGQKLIWDRAIEVPSIAWQRLEMECIPVISNSIFDMDVERFVHRILGEVRRTTRNALFRCFALKNRRYDAPTAG